MSGWTHLQLCTKILPKSWHWPHQPIVNTSCNGGVMNQLLCSSENEGRTWIRNSDYLVPLTIFEVSSVLSHFFYHIFFLPDTKSFLLRCYIFTISRISHSVSYLWVHNSLELTLQLLDTQSHPHPNCSSVAFGAWLFNGAGWGVNSCEGGCWGGPPCCRFDAAPSTPTGGWRPPPGGGGGGWAKIGAPGAGGARPCGDGGGWGRNWKCAIQSIFNLFSKISC